MADHVFTLPELASLVDVEYRTLHTWVRRGLVAPSCRQAQGSGTRNLFDHDDALDTYVLAGLRRAGVPLAKLEQVATELRRLRSDSSWRDPVLVVNGRVSLSTRSNLSDAVRDSIPTVVYDLGHARAGLGKRLALEV